MPDSLLERAQQAVEVATSAGASDAFATANKSREVEINVRDGKVETVKEATSKSISIRLWVDGRYGSHSTNDLRPDSLSTFVADAVALSRSVQPDPFREITDPALFEGQANLDLELSDVRVASLTREDRLALCMAQNDGLRGKEHVISASSGTSDNVGESAMVSSNGFSGEQQTSSLWIGSEVTLQGEGDKKPEAWMWGGARHREGVPDPAYVAELTLARGLARLGSQKGPTTRTTMIVDPSISGSIVSRLLRPSTGYWLSQDRSFWKGRIGKASISEKFTLIDDPLLPRGFSSRLYDSEGIAAKRLSIIENGVLKNLYMDTYYGKKLDMPPTTGGSSNIIVSSGSRSLEEVIADTPEAVYVTSWLGGNADKTTGDFSLGLRGHLIKDGEIGGPVSEMNITGNLIDLFSSLIEVGNDPWPYSSRKVPTLVFEGVSFSGA